MASVVRASVVHTLVLGIGIGIGLSMGGVVSKLNAAPNGMRVEGPFEVLGIDGRVVFHVSDQPAEAAARSQARVTISRGSAANYVLQFRNSNGKYVSSIGESAAGLGVAHFHDAAGAVRARSDGGGFFLFNPSGTIVGSFGLGPSSGGVVELMNPSGAKMVEAGAYADGVGRVVVGPMFKCAGNAGAMGLGIPDCIKGRLK